MRRIVLIAVAAAFAAPATAQAKEVSKLELCGVSECASTSDRELLALIGEGSDGGTTSSTPGLQPSTG